MNNSKKRLLELAGVPLTEVTRRGFLAGLGAGAAGGMAAGVSRGQQLEAARQWFLSVHDDEGLNGIVGPFDSQNEAEDYADDVYRKLEHIAPYIELDVSDGISPGDFSKLLEAEFKAMKDYETQHKGKKQQPTIQT